MSTELSIKVSDAELARVESIAAQCSLSALGNAGHFQRAFKMAAGIRALREAITPAMMADLMSLQGTSLGFRTDKDKGGGYSPEVVKECAMEAALRGAYWVGNEFNIIAARPYLTKEFFVRVLREFPGLTDLRLFPGVPKSGSSGALVQYSATWKLGGRLDRMDRLETKLEDGTILDERICVRVNEGMGADAILGKAERKMRAAIFARITGSEVMDGEADDSGNASRSIRKLDDLTNRIETKTTEVNPDLKEEPHDYDSTFSGCQQITDVDKILAELDATDDPTVNRADVEAAAERRRQAIRAKRGAGSNKQTTMV